MLSRLADNVGERPGEGLRILVIGCGSIGRRHIRLLREMDAVVIGCDSDAEALATTGPGYIDIREAIAHDWDGIVVASPPHMHCDHVLCSTGYGAPPCVLVEKPMCVTTADAWALALPWRPPFLVGYSLRWHPGMRKMKSLLDEGAIGFPVSARIWCGSYLPAWRPGADYRQGYAAHADQGGGVLLDISHELDYACWLFGDPDTVMCTLQRSGALEIETEDVADVVLAFRSGAQASIHLDYLDRGGNERGCRVVGTDGELQWDFAKYGAEFSGPHSAGASTSTKTRRLFYAEDVETWRREGAVLASLVEPDDVYRAELRHFLRVVRGEEAPECTARDGLRAVLLAEAAKQSHKSGRRVRVRLPK